MPKFYKPQLKGHRGRRLPPVPKLWPESTVVCIASGPSLTREDCEFVRGRARVIVVNSSYKMAPWADALYACDERWYRWNKGAMDFQGLKFGMAAARWLLPSMHASAIKWKVHLLHRGAPTGLSTDPATLNTGKNSGYQAINLAVHLGASQIVLLGYDMQPGLNGQKHWHPDHPVKTPDLYRSFRAFYQTLGEPLRARGISVVNCTRQTALEAFPCEPLESVFPAVEQVA